MIFLILSLWSLFVSYDAYIIFTWVLQFEIFAVRGSTSSRWSRTATTPGIAQQAVPSSRMPLTNDYADFWQKKGSRDWTVWRLIQLEQGLGQLHRAPFFLLITEDPNSSTWSVDKIFNSMDLSFFSSFTVVKHQLLNTCEPHQRTRTKGFVYNNSTGRKASMFTISPRTTRP